MQFKTTTANEALEKFIKKSRELLALYVPIGNFRWRRLFPESFYESNGFLKKDETEFVSLVYEIFLLVLSGSKKNLIEDELNLIYMDIEYKSKSERLSDAILSAIEERIVLKKQYLTEIELLAKETESVFSDDSPIILPIKFRLESTTYLVRLLAYGLFTDNNMMFDRISEVFDMNRLQSATKPEDKHGMDETLKFLYKGLIQKNDRGRQGSRRAAHETLKVLKEWYPDSGYVRWCIDHIEKYV